MYIYKHNSSKADCIASEVNYSFLGHTLFDRKSTVAASFRFYKQAYFIGSCGSIF